MNEKLYQNRDWLFREYIIKELSVVSIAKKCNVSQGLISRYLIKFDIPRRKFAGRGGKLCSRWKNGRTRTKTGYIWIHVDEPHLHQVSKRHKYVPEQIIVAEKYLGRKLTKEEVVHHINKIKDDNRIENLFLFSSESEHQTYHQKSRGGLCEPITKSNLVE